MATGTLYRAAALDAYGDPVDSDATSSASAVTAPAWASFTHRDRWPVLATR